MPRVLLLVAIAIIGYLTWQWFSRLPADQKRQQFIRIGLWVLVAVALLLVATGRLHWLGAALATVFATGRSLLPLALKLLPWLAQRKQQNHPQKTPDKGMSLSDAYAILGLDENATKQEITDAHRRLMAKNHPDKGGNDFLAAQLNTAKDLIIASMA